MAKNRWAQMQEPSIIMPLVEKSDEACSIDGLRPANPNHKNPKDETKHFSSFTFDRRVIGLKTKRKLYSKIIEEISDSINNDILKKLEHQSFTDNMEDLSEDDSKGNLSGKIAFIYLDGNKFGAIRDKYCTSKEKMSAFFDTVQHKLRARILENILRSAIDDVDFKSKSNQVRLETLLWGGDEIEWVVPAWKGFEILKQTYSVDETFAVAQETDLLSIPLTHACGIVFCHHSAPILAIRKIAHLLAEKVKENNKDIPQKSSEGNYIHYMVMESYDMITGNIDAFFAKHYKNADPDHLKLAGDELNIFEKEFITIKKYFPRNKVYKIIQLLNSNETGYQSKISAEITKVQKTINKDFQDELESSLNRVIKNQIDRWYIIADLWDYISIGGKNASH
jgi:hypothetical protein